MTPDTGPGPKPTPRLRDDFLHCLHLGAAQGFAAPLPQTENRSLDGGMPLLDPDRLAAVEQVFMSGVAQCNPAMSAKPKALSTL